MARKYVKPVDVVGGVCLYGNSAAAGWFAHVGPLAAGKLLGDGEPRDGRGLNDAFWLACAALRDAGVKVGRVEVFEPSGRLMALADVNWPGYYGSLKWEPAPVYSLSAEEVMAASEKA